MVELRTATFGMFRRACLTAAGIAALVGPAEARHHHHHVAHVAHRGRVAIFHRAVRPRISLVSGVPPFSEYAVDGNTGRVLFARDENAPRHPASITKVMTLYLLFEKLERGELSLDTRIDVSPHAAAQAPTKLGLRPGSTIRIEDAIKAIVTKSANDMAVAIAERLGGNEETFARMMTRKAHALGMSRSVFVNASGLPDDRQITTAHDLVVLGRAIHDRYPRYFRFFSTPSFRYAGQFMPNHNHLMEQVEGMDGIKTGYTRSSGFNLLSSVSRNGHWLVSVVLGGRTRLGRDRIMADLIESQIDKCGTHRTAPMVAENPALEQQVAEAIPVVQHEGEAAPPVETLDDESAEGRPGATEDARASAGADTDQPAAEPPPRPVAPIAPPVRVASLAPDVAAHPRPAFVSAMTRPGDRDMTATGSIRPRGHIDGSTPHFEPETTATPSALRHARRERAAGDKPKPVQIASLATDLPTGRPGSARGGWMIQIGATPTLEAANELLARAKGESHGALGTAKPFTEKVAKGGGTLFRARFAGLDPAGAERACKSLKKAGLACFATKN